MTDTPELIAIAAQLELDMERQLRRERHETRPDRQLRQRRLLEVYRHGRALRIALENWFELSRQD